ncbi:MAG: hypothetical protein CVV44_08700 [Spirochaetae bacterium HGW-Spirochaetae-1]|jgi:hypothetical protein|nr:MAG: hypothetical protein CVV44_08700 [Spirochaetae bacterium HGW-Spirochaetae-1]
MDKMSKKVRENYELRNLPENTQKRYLPIIRQYSEYFNRSPIEIGSQEIRDYLLCTLSNKNEFNPHNRCLIGFAERVGGPPASSYRMSR